MSDLGLLRVAAGTPKIKIANPAANAEEIIGLIKKAQAGAAGLLVLPEMAVTGCTIGDLAKQELLIEEEYKAISRIAEETEGLDTAVVLGALVRIGDTPVSCGLLIRDGHILGAVPKTEHMPACADGLYGHGPVLVRINEEEVPYGSLLFEDAQGLCIGVEVGSDMFLPVSPATLLALRGAKLIVNPAGDFDMVDRAWFRKNVIAVQTAKVPCGYVYAGAGTGESTTDCVYSGHKIIAECGQVLVEGERFLRESSIVFAEIDLSRISRDRQDMPPKGPQGGPGAPAGHGEGGQKISVGSLRYYFPGDGELTRSVAKNPFAPADKAALDERCEEIYRIQCAALAKRLEHTGIRKTVVGISGGLDSTLALLVCTGTHRLLGLPAENIIAITMPGFGTTSQTKGNAVTLMERTGATIREISIKNAVLSHFSDIGQDPDNHDLTYENSQARERTQILMDVAGMEGGIVVGTGDLSEESLGWCTFNGDHMAMYNVNCGIPKTMMQHIVRWLAQSAEDRVLADTLLAVLDTPISPELLPPDASGKIAQKTEDKVGPYELHDFFIYYTLRYGMKPDKVLFLACRAFEGVYEREYIEKWLRTFYRRFFSQQFKRSCAPDGPKVGSVGISPRGDLMMPSDADGFIWR